jgi:hypothetical protein
MKNLRVRSPSETPFALPRPWSPDLVRVGGTRFVTVYRDRKRGIFPVQSGRAEGVECWWIGDASAAAWGKAWLHMHQAGRIIRIPLYPETPSAEAVWEALASSHASLEGVLSLASRLGILGAGWEPGVPWSGVLASDQRMGVLRSRFQDLLEFLMAAGLPPELLVVLGKAALDREPDSDLPHPENRLWLSPPDFLQAGARWPEAVDVEGCCGGVWLGPGTRFRPDNNSWFSRSWSGGVLYTPCVLENFAKTWQEHSSWEVRALSVLRSTT